MRSSRDLKTLTTQPKRCRSHTIIAKNLTGFQQVEVSAKIIDSGNACSFDEDNEKRWKAYIPTRPHKR